MRRQLGEILIARELITSEQLERALSIQKRTGQRVGQVLLDLRFLDRDHLLEVLAEQLETTATRISADVVNVEAVRMLPERLARRAEALAIACDADALTVAMADPRNLGLLDDLRFATGLNIRTTVALEDEIARGIDRFYREEIPTEQLDPADPLAFERPLPLVLERDADDDQAAVRLLDQILTRAIADRASDIHLEPQEEGSVVRLRVDGLLGEIARLPPSIAPALTARVKVLASIDIAEHRVPQDGRFTATVGSRRLDIRVGTYPTLWGEKTVLRLLDRDSLRVTLEAVGLSDDVLQVWQDFVRRPEGMLLVTGPTGSGKTSTLYASLLGIVDTGRNIVTIENPIEYDIAGINQAQTNDRAGFTFASALRAILRQDPDVILVGEIRDSETLDFSIEAALTGHLVMSTLHTASAAGSIARLLDMGVERYAVASTILAVMAQRLVRLVCDRCAEEGPLDADGEELLQPDLPATSIRGAGCRECRMTGYRGRIGIFELLLLSRDIRRLIVKGAPEAEIERAAHESAGFRSLRDEGLKLVREGRTTPEEILRVTQLR